MADAYSTTGGGRKNVRALDDQPSEPAGEVNGDAANTNQTTENRQQTNSVQADGDPKCENEVDDSILDETSKEFKHTFFSALTHAQGDLYQVLESLWPKTEDSEVMDRVQSLQEKVKDMEACVEADYIQKVLDDKAEAFGFYLNTAQKYELGEATLKKLRHIAEG